jgi:hypothetical protein
MKVLKGLIVAAILLFLGLMCSCQALAIHDRNTRQNVLAVVARELPVGASLDDKRAFLQGHRLATDSNAAWSSAITDLRGAGAPR